MARIPVIIVSASPRALPVESKCQDMSNVVDTIAKPFAPRMLVESVKRALARLDGPPLAGVNN
jgi:CheY-like chemotaxis protein